MELKDDVDISGITINKGFWLDHMFIAPNQIRRGIGEKLFGHLKKKCIQKGIGDLGILADPNARGFYEKMGCAYKGEYPSPIKDRTTPFLVLTDL